MNIKHFLSSNSNNHLQTKKGEDMKKIRTTVISLFLIFAVSSSALANGLSLNSVGTRALGMGGAFVGLANDGSAIYWNPAGLAGQESSLDLYFTGIMPSGTYKLDAAAIDASMKSNLYTAPGFFGNYSFGKWAVGLGIYVPAGLGAEWNGAELKNLTAPFPDQYEWMSQIGVISFSPAVAYQISDKFSLGLAVNINYGLFDMKRPGDPIDVTGDGIPDVLPQYTETSSGIGYSATLGLKWDVCKQVSLGATFRSASKVSMSGDAEVVGLMKSEFDRDVTWPMWIAGGVAYKPNERLTLTLDAQYSQWSELDKLTTKYKSLPEGEFILNWKDAVQIRLGGEYFVSKPIAIRLGYYYDPAPGPDDTYNILFPSMTNNVITGGFGYYVDKLSVQAGLEYLMGAERTIKPSAHNMPGIHQMNVLAFSIGLGWKF
ncbi:Long-chain fatty acid transport protein-like [hydrothermal vent metagenome]|uniref:Long-chain fatty acid transport protein-like n=1 Tax=hydrothermal vent metagenome TaxID=652676 RepID=A0A3B1CIT9_9ZZZZ